LVGFALMAAQAFCYNAIFFNYDKVLEHYFDVSRDKVGWYFLAFALGNFAGPIVLGRFFDTSGRKLMISLTYASSGLLLAGSACLFITGHEYAWLQAAAWTVVFFFVSAAASSAYLTVGETFPLEIRALTIGVFYAIGTGIVLFSPRLFRALIDSQLSLFV